MKLSHPLLREAYAIVDGIPNDKFDMGDLLYANSPDPVHDCGSAGCALGWLGFHPEFSKKSGLKSHMRGESFQGISSRKYPLNSCVDFTVVAADVFNISRNEAEYIFKPVSFSERNGDCDGPQKSDKEVFKYRVRKFLTGS